MLMVPAATIHAQSKLSTGTPQGSAVFLAGAATSNITPAIGTSINGNFQDVRVKNIHDELHARSVVLDDGNARLAIVVSDLCMIPREILDKAKLRAHEYTGIPATNMLMSATHTHSGGTACPVFQSDPDEEYVAFLSQRIADAVIRANENRAPARIGWGVGSEPTQVFNRRWKMKPGVSMPNPFGGQDQVLMNPGVANPAMVEPAGPTDPEVPVVSIQSLDGRPIALLANYSLHYVGGTGEGEVSADYYGMFANRMHELLGGQNNEFVAIMSNGTSGDINNIHWAGGTETSPRPYDQMQHVANTLAAEVYEVYQNIRYHDWVPLAAEQKEISLGVRLPSKGDVARAKEIVARAEGPVLYKRDEIYARETLFLKDYPKQVPVILQALQIGDLAITAIPCEVFAEIGLEIKKKSPFSPTFSISLANGYNGYLPTPQQHQAGGYETWRARSSYLETGASVKITETLFELLDRLKKGPSTYEADMPAKSKTIALFNGQNLANWYTFLKGRGRDNDPKKVFTVRDGLLHISGEEWGSITTNEEYENYKLVVEFKWAGGTHEPRVDKARDCGILLHSNGKDGGYDGTWMHSIECQIIEGGTGDFIVVSDGSKKFSVTSPVAPDKQGSSYVYQPGGNLATIHGGRINWYGRDPEWKDAIDFRGKKDIENPVGEWNTMECIAYKEQIFVYLNGVLVNHAVNVYPRKGRIQIQSEAAEIVFRKVELTPLEK